MQEGYKIYRTKETVNVLIPCTLIDRLLNQGGNFSIIIVAVSDPLLLPRPRPVSRPASSRSTVEEVNSSPFYQDVLAEDLSLDH